MIKRQRILGLVSVVLLLAAAAPARADVTDDCVAANEKSIELLRARKLLEARAETAKCSLEACGADIQRVCMQRVGEISASLASVVFEVKDETGADVVQARVLIDGAPAEGATVTAITLDPGEHRYVVQVVGRVPVERTFVVREGERQRRERVVLPSPAPTDVAPSAGEVSPPVEPSATGSPGSTQRIVGLTIGGAGLVGIVLGGIFGLTASSKWDEAKSACTSGGRTGCAPDDSAQEKKSDAESAAALSTISFVAGGALVAAGAVVFFSAPRANRSQPSSGSLRIAPSAGPRVGGLFLKGTF